MSPPDDDPPRNDEAFFSRWSRRKQAVQRSHTPPPREPEAPNSTAAGKPDASTGQSHQKPTQGKAEAAPATPVWTPRALNESDFADVDFSKLDYASDYSRFTAAGVPESIKQKALTQLWHSDPIFTQVDPFQDYAGDYTDAALVPKTALKTAYRVGQGFLSDSEAHEWDRLGKPAVAPELAALPELRPGYRVRAATLDDADAMAALQAAAIHASARETYGEAAATSWAHGLTGGLIADAMRNGAVGYVALDETNGAIAGMIGRTGPDIEALFVGPTHGRRGIARRLVETTLRDVETPDASAPITVAASRVSRPLFERLGWRMTASRDLVTRGGLALEVFDMTRPAVTDATFAITQETADQPDVRAFFAASEAYMGALYPAESNHFVDASALAQANVAFLVARLQGAAVGCGAVVADADGSGEIKRMWVAPATRGLKLGVRLLDALQAAAQTRGIDVLRLETGIHQPEAIGLYRRAGFVEIGPFGAYQPDPLSLFMEKRLG